MANVITCIELSDYKNNNQRNYLYLSIDEFGNKIKELYHTDKSLFEIIDCPLVNLFLDIEHIPIDKPELISELFTDLVNTLTNINKNYVRYNTIITINKNSKYKGLSYHIYMPVIFKLIDIKIYLCYFLYKYPQYKDYIDLSIYNFNRLFRVIGSIDPVTKDIFSTHEIYYMYGKFINNLDLKEIINNKYDFGFIISRICIHNISDNHFYCNKLQYDKGLEYINKYSCYYSDYEFDSNDVNLIISLFSCVMYMICILICSGISLITRER